MKTVSTSNKLNLVERGDYYYAEGTGSIDDRNAIVRDVRAKLQAISPEAWELAKALACIDKWRPEGYAAKLQEIRDGKHVVAVDD